MIHYTCPMLFPALSLPFLIGGRDGTTPLFTVVSIHPHKVLLQHLQQSMWPFCGLIPLPHWSTTIHSSPPTTNCHLTGRRRAFLQLRTISRKVMLKASDAWPQSMLEWCTAGYWRPSFQVENLNRRLRSQWRTPMRWACHEGSWAKRIASQHSRQCGCRLQHSRAHIWQPACSSASSAAHSLARQDNINDLTTSW